MDLIMGSFANKYVPEFTPEELDCYEEVLQNSDPDLYDWISGRVEMPANLKNPILEKLLDHQYARSKATGSTQDNE